MEKYRNAQNIINEAYNNIDNVHFSDLELVETINLIIQGLDCGALRVVDYVTNTWLVNDWIKKAILLYFKIFPSKVIPCQPGPYFCKVDLKYTEYEKEDFIQDQVRIVPGSVVRKGAYIGHNSVVMPSFINIGAYVGSHTMIDTWATVGSCVQVGNNVHISGGAGLGGVLEPLQTLPTIIEDNCFIGARSEIVEGVVVRKGSVIGMGVYIGQSTKIFDRETKTISYGVIPEYSVVVPGALPSEDNSHMVYAAIIIKKVDEKTRKKVLINELLRS